MKTSRLKAVWPWLGEARYLWLSLAVIGIALVVAFCPHTSEPTIRLTGLVLQLLGIGTVIWGISETRSLFGYPSFASKTIAWLNRFPFLSSDAAVGQADLGLSLAAVKGRGYQTHAPGDDASIDARVDALEKNVIAIHERITQTQKEMDEEFQKAANTIKREAQSRREEDDAIKKKLEATGTGGVHISAVGASWLFVGVVLSTAAAEIASFLK